MGFLWSYELIKCIRVEEGKEGLPINLCEHRLFRGTEGPGQFPEGAISGEIFSEIFIYTLNAPQGVATGFR